jgi:probable phosphoglycerate mutase
MTSEAWLYRHGESVSNAGEPTFTPWDICITDLGKQQAKNIAAQFSSPPDRVIVSGYLRTQQTARPLVSKFNLDCLHPMVNRVNLDPKSSAYLQKLPSRYQMWPVQEWTFLCPDRYFGTTQEERKVPVREYRNKRDPNLVDGFGAESFQQFLLRVGVFLLRIENEPGLSVVFTHGHFMRAILWLHQTKLDFRRVGVDEFDSYWDFFDKTEIPNGHKLVLPLL